MNTARSLTLGHSVGFLAATVAVAGDFLGWFNCVNAWLFETVVLTLCLAVAVRRFRTVTIGSSAAFAYITIISYVMIHAHRSGRWLSDDWTPVFASFFFLVVLPIVFAGALDLASLRHARDEVSRRAGPHRYRNMLTAFTKFTRRAQLAFVLGIVAFVICGCQTCQQPSASEQAQMERYGFTKDAPEEDSGSNLLVALGNLLGGLCH